MELAGWLRMEARSGIQWIVEIFTIVAEHSFPTFPVSVFAYNNCIDLRVSAVPENSNGWIDKAVGIHNNFHIFDVDFSIRFTFTHAKVFNLRIST